MLFETFDQFFRFRDRCLCGYVLSTNFKYSSADDDYVNIKPAGSYSVDKINDNVVFPLEMESRLAPHGEVSFLINCKIHQNRITIQTKSFSRTVISPLDFIIKHFNQKSQVGLNIQIFRSCMNPNRCGHNYQLTSEPIMFDLRSKIIQPISVYSENFRIVHNDHTYGFYSAFGKDVTTVSLDEVQGIFHIPKVEKIEMPLEKYLGFPFEREFLLNKIKTLVLFS